MRVRGEIPQLPCPLDRYDLKADIRSVVFEGPNGAALAPEIQSLIAPIGAARAIGEQPLTAICAIRDSAVAALDRAGYVATVQIPPQRIETGELRLTVVTAQIIEVRVRGEPGPYADTLEARIAQLKALAPLNRRDAERVLLLAGDIPGLDVQLLLRPAGTAPGEVIGELNVVYKPFSIIANVQNFGSRQLGRETAFVRAEFYGLTGAADLTYIGASSTLDFEEQQIVQIGHIMGLGQSGLTGAANFTYAWSKPSIGTLDIRSRTLIGDVELRAPLLRTVNERIYLSGGFQFLEQRTRSLSTPLALDKLRLLYVRADGDFREAGAPGGYDRFNLHGDLQFKQGLDIFSATKQGRNPGTTTPPSRDQGDPTALVVSGNFEAAAGIGRFVQLYGRATGQWANNPLLNYQEYAIGNFTIGRGYDPGANSGDRAIGVRGELRVRPVLKPRFWAEAFGFYDNVWLKNLDANTTEDDRRLSSYGGGLRFTLPGRAYLEGMYARPENKALRTDTKRAPGRFLLSLTVQLN